MGAKLGPVPRYWAPAGPQEDLALALIMSRVVALASKLSAVAWWDDATPA